MTWPMGRHILVPFPFYDNEQRQIIYGYTNIALMFLGYNFLKEYLIQTVMFKRNYNLMPSKRI